MLPFGNNGGRYALERNVTIVTPQDVFLASFSLHPAGVAVITGLLDDGSPVGFTATSLASFSSDPPRASFNIARHSSSFGAIDMGKDLLLHFLAADQISLARKMAAASQDRFVGNHWAPGIGDLPQLHGVRAELRATVVAVTRVGENAAVVVEITEGNTHPDRPPLVYVERNYHVVGDALLD
jgi:flavin reductase (DIM6/NTAB) family NADH-FMN oxidoreductase RutF